MINNYSTHRIAITPGEPAGIGPDLTIQLAQRNWPVELVVCADGELLYKRAAQIGLPLKLMDYNPDIEPHPQQAGSLTLLQVNTVQPVIAGSLEIDNSIYVVNTLTRTCEGCLNKEFLALITGPVHKGIINEAGILFTGHTEFLAKLAGCNRAVMMLATKEMRVALATTHLPLKDVSTAISYDCLYEVINIIYHDMKRKFAILNPHIFVCGLNPHSGESGYLGREEIETIIPVINALRRQGMQLTGPLPADTIFQQKYLQQANVVLAMYHDQGLPVLKFHGFSQAVNVTLGLPFIRTSVDHGTALELAGLGVVNPKSFITAINLALSILNNSNEQSNVSETLFS